MSEEEEGKEEYEEHEEEGAREERADALDEDDYTMKLPPKYHDVKGDALVEQ